jgi:monovalent cation/hydrogen antiporter
MRPPGRHRGVSSNTTWCRYRASPYSWCSSPLLLLYVLDGIHGHSNLSLLKYALRFPPSWYYCMAWMYPAARAAWWVRTHVVKQIYERPKLNQVLSWRGPECVGSSPWLAANSLPLTLNDGSPFPQRNFIIFLTFSLILVPLVVQGLSLPWLLRMPRLESELAFYLASLLSSCSGTYGNMHHM